MTIHVNIGEAKTRLSALIAAAKRGEKVFIDRDGEPEIELIPVSPKTEKDARRARLKAWIGSLSGQGGDPDILLESNFTDAELDALHRPDF